MNYSFKKCLYDPDAADFEMSANRLLVEIKNPDLLKYVIMMYDPHSPVRQRFPEMKNRIEEASELSGYNMIGGRMPEPLVKAAISYLKVVNSRIWALIVGIEQAIWGGTENFFVPMTKDEEGTGKDLVAGLKLRSGLATDLIEMNDQLDALYVRFYGDEELQREAAQVENQRVAEDYAKILKNKSKNVR